MNFARGYVMSIDRPKQRAWTVGEKARIVAEAESLKGETLTAFLQRNDVKLIDFEQWRSALEDRETASLAMSKRVRSLERDY